MSDQSETAIELSSTGTSVSRSTLESNSEEFVTESASVDTTQQPSTEQMQKHSDRPNDKHRWPNHNTWSAGALKPNDSRASPKSKQSVRITAQAVQKMGGKLVKMEHKLKRQSWCPLLYLIVLPAYTFLGGFIFQAVEGANDNRLIEEFERRCIDERNSVTAKLQSLMMGERVNATVAEMFVAANATIMAVDKCIRQSQPITILSMSHLGNALRYAVTIYTTLGYGNMAAKTVGGRVLTMFYAMAGIPIFLAFTTDWGLVFSNLLNWISAFAESRLRRWRMKMKQKKVLEESNQQHAIGRPQLNKTVRMQLNEEPPRDDSDPLRELRRFGIIMVLFIFYFFVVSALVQALEVNEKWSYIDALHFIFASVTLIGFGDLYPIDNVMFLCVEMPLICLGTTLIAMAYYFMQEEIRTIPVKAQRSFKYISSVRTGRNKTTDATSQHLVKIDEGEPLTSVSSSTASEMTAYQSRPTCAILESTRPQTPN